MTSLGSSGRSVLNTDCDSHGEYYSLVSISCLCLELDQTETDDGCVPAVTLDKSPNHAII